jgi:hypothetical protein
VGVGGSVCTVSSATPEALVTIHNVLPLYMLRLIGGGLCRDSPLSCRPLIGDAHFRGE